jgi:hypothetical protein
VPGSVLISAGQVHCYPQQTASSSFEIMPGYVIPFRRISGHRVQISY